MVIENLFLDINLLIARLPEFVVLVTKNKSGQPLYARSWGNGFLPSKYQGVQFRSDTDTEVIPHLIAEQIY